MNYDHKIIFEHAYIFSSISTSAVAVKTFRLSLNPECGSFVYRRRIFCSPSYDNITGNNRNMLDSTVITFYNDFSYFCLIYLYINTIIKMMD